MCAVKITSFRDIRNRKLNLINFEALSQYPGYKISAALRRICVRSMSGTRVSQL